MKDIEIWKACFAGLARRQQHLDLLHWTRPNMRYRQRSFVFGGSSTFYPRNPDQGIIMNHLLSSNPEISQYARMLASTSSNPTRSLKISHTVHMLPAVELTRSLHPKELSKHTMFEMFEA